MARVLVVAALPLVALTCLACFHDFGAFDPVGGDGAAPRADDGGGMDAANLPPPTDASPEADVAPPPPRGDASGCGADCRSQATICAGTCNEIEESCEAPPGCDGGSCVQACESADSTCTSQCVTTCETCTSDEGCIDPKGCTAAAP
jgi:hypothetical protein